MSNRILSVYFNTDKTYLTVIQPGAKGIEMTYVNSTEHQIDLENMDSLITQRGLDELQGLLDEVDGMADKLTVTIPPESVVVTQIPGDAKMKEDQLRKLIGLEIRHAYPQFNPEQFSSNIIPLANTSKNQNMMLAVIMPREIVKSCLTAFEKSNFDVENIEISQLNAHSAFMYNYPERADQNIIFVSVGEQFMDISVAYKGQPAYYNLLNLPDKSEIGAAFEEEFNNITANVADGIQAAFFFGNGLDKDIYLSLWETAMLLGIEVQRLNAFRMVTTELPERVRQYCSRTQHIFPPCIGGSFPAYHKRISLY